MVFWLFLAVLAAALKADRITALQAGRVGGETVKNC